MFKRINWLWLPMMMSIFGVYAIQRGFATFAKSADFVVPHMQLGLGIFFTVMSLVVLVGGYLLDNYNSKNLFLISGLLGAVGIVSVPYSPWAFGILFGTAAAFLKLAPYSAPMKIYNENEAVKICPQAAAKNLGGAAFILFLGGLLISLGWNYVTTILAAFFMAACLFSYLILPNDKIEGWKWSIFKESSKSIKFWGFMVYFFFMCGIYYVAIMGFYPALKGIGFTATTATTTLAISYLCAGALRWPAAYLGNYMRLPLMWIGVAGMAIAIFLTKIHPVGALVLFTLSSTIHTPNYWAYCKEQWGPRYIATIIALGFVFQYLGAGVFYGKW